ncbi:MAG TPA: bifunctional UDP-sugar hydrolase/5'-nucleotidase, partial [Bryobacteraceae bacterium]
MRNCRRVAGLLLLAAVSLTAEVRSLTILHTNDIHARLTPLANHNGGFAYLAATIQKERAGCTDCILLNAGDLVQGTPVSTIFHGLPVFEMGNAFGFDAATLGNHEFDYGWMQVRKFIATAKYPIVSANVVGKNGQLFTKDPYVILKVNGLRVAVLGLMTADLNNFSTPGLMGEWHTAPINETARKYAAELRDKSDLIVALAHIGGKEEDSFLANVTEIPVVVSGHIHTGMTGAKMNNGRLMVRVKGYTEELGRLELKVDTEKKAPVAWSWKRITVDSQQIAPDPDLTREVKHWEGEVTARVDKPLAVSTRTFSHRDVQALIERALREETGSDFAFMNYGGVRDILPSGQLLVRHIWNIMPFDNRVLVGTFKGRDLPRVVVGKRQIDPDRDYTLAVSDFTAANQATPENLNATGLKFPNDVGLMRD